jgi:hypothetical protein
VQLDRERGVLGGVRWNATRFGRAIAHRLSGGSHRVEHDLVDLLWEVEPPPSHPLHDRRLVLVDRDIRRGEHTAVVGAAGPRTMLVDRARSFDEHRAMALLVVPEDDSALRLSWRRKEER